VASQATSRDELMRMWALKDGTRCVLATMWGVLELRVVHEDTVVRRGVYASFRRALAAARQWRVDWETEGQLCHPTGTRIGCPRCGGELPDADCSRLIEWLWCRSCGYVWVLYRRDSTVSGHA
jgi:hypothetical protein